MMLNSKNNNKRLLLALVCGSMSYSTFAQVYSWRDADGAMHYSQFPRQIVEKNAAQSRASRKQADINDVVNDLASTKKRDDLLDGLDDIVAKANVERQVEKVLTRRDPQLVLIEQQLARQQAEQYALLAAKQQVLQDHALKGRVLKEQIINERLALATDSQINRIETKQAFTKNSFMAGIHKRAYGNVDTKNNNVIQPSSRIEPVVIAKVQPVIKPVVEPGSIAKVIRQPKAKPKNAFLAGIKRKLNRQQQTQDIDEPMDLVSQKLASQNLVTQSQSVVASNIATGKQLQATPEQVQDKFLAEINKKLFRTYVATDNTPVVKLVSSKDINGNSRTTTVKNKELIQGADQIKAIENEISNSSQSNKTKAPSAKQVNSALMLSRLSYNQQGRLPLFGAGINQLDIQGIDASSQFVNEVNRNAE